MHHIYLIICIIGQEMDRIRLTTRLRRQRRQELLEWFNDVVRVVVFIVVSLWIIMVKRQRDRRQIRHFSSNVNRSSILHRYVYESDAMSISQIRMTRLCFKKLCDMLETYGGLRTNRFISIEEQVAIFLHIVAHNVKNRVMICRFHRSGDTISRVVSRVCNAIIRLHPQLLKKPEPVPDNSTDQRWKWFKNCLGALDETYIKCKVPLEDKPRYRTRKNEIATNVLGVCSQDMQFIYVLPVSNYVHKLTNHVITHPMLQDT
ncbi:hypothetical protein OSB04_013251 [Centaurea solstitialis]|uniref:DUF8040 domain-containing protein n=1 Tax=Centaurea solstitialis TaxID=347529 RepID=A0AA38WET3_9ASTR|nr:hypothetical protein OSB04_013251 [Centaurea solstitialis]